MGREGSGGRERTRAVDRGGDLEGRGVWVGGGGGELEEGGASCRRGEGGF